MIPSNKSIQKQLLELIDNSTNKITPLQLEKILSQKLKSTRQNIRWAIKNLVVQGLITYTNFYGQTYIERSFHTPNRLSESVIVKPPEITLPVKSKEVVITIRPGAAFGNGSHPSTRLAVKGLEYTLRKTPFLKSHEKTRMLDIGTGSGILSMVALKFGIHDAVGLDIDPCSQFESRQNAQLNGLANRYEIKNQLLEHIQDTFHLITANMRFSTLIHICSKIRSIILSQGVVILSGIKTEEASHLAEIYQKNRFTCIWGDGEKGWECGVFIKNTHNKSLDFLSDFK